MMYFDDALQTCSWSNPRINILAVVGPRRWRTREMTNSISFGGLQQPATAQKQTPATHPPTANRRRTESNPLRTRSGIKNDRSRMQSNFRRGRCRLRCTTDRSTRRVERAVHFSPRPPSVRPFGRQTPQITTSDLNAVARKNSVRAARPAEGKDPARKRFPISPRRIWQPFVG